MNMFKKNKKGKHQDDGLPTFASEPNSMAKASRGLTRKKKKQDIEEKPVFDLSSALPDSNEFRTSLLMPNLSARFSMLREQDDPNTKVGKASDDSVLFPKRSSRMNLFNSNALGDIAEVESIRSGFRPPFADENQGSFSDGYASDDGGSVMTRARHGEGNNLFGGRQKLYKVPTASTKDVSTRKHMYENDVSLSAFQQYRRKEREGKEQHADDSTDRSSYPVTDYDEHDSTPSPLTGFSQNRGTQSSTNSGPSNRRTSTAATSVISESPLLQSSDHAINKIREQDANSSAESIGFASSPGLRNISNEDNRPPFRLSGSRSVANIRDNYSRQSPVPTYRARSPTINAMAELDFGLKDKKPPMSSPRQRTASPAFDLGHNDPLANNVRPNDRGKATAMGLFNKPARHYDDIQFQQRQVQMHEGRNSPISVNSRAASRASPDPVRSGHQSYSSANAVTPQEHRSTPQIPPIPDYPPSPVSNRRTSASSTGRRSSSRPRAKSTASVREAVVKARVESLIRRQNAELAAREANELGPPRKLPEDQGASLSDDKAQGGTFFDNSDYSEEEEQQTKPASTYLTQPRNPPPLPPSDIHPALRSGETTFDFDTDSRESAYTRHSNYSAASKSRISAEPTQRAEHESVLSVASNDSRTLPAAGLGLSGLIRTHLRQDSDKSSILPPPSPGILGADGSRGSVSSTARTVTESVKSDPFEYDSERLNVPASPKQPDEPPTPTVVMSQRAQQILEQAKAIRDAQIREDHTPLVEPPTPIQGSYDSEPFGMSVGPSHRRNESTETQREQQRFDDELAERRKRVQEGLKSVQERSRSRSPAAEPNANANHGFSLPRFPGRSNAGDRNDSSSQNKAMKMLGISAPREQVPSPRMRQDAHNYEHHDRSRDVRSHQGHPSPMPNDHDRSNGRYTPNSGRSATRHGDRPPPPRSTTPSNRRDNRERSDSAAADRSASRNKHVPEFNPRMIPGAFPHSPIVVGSPNELGQRSESPVMYERSGSRNDQHDKSGYFGSKALAPPLELAHSFTPRPSPRPSPSSADTAFKPQSAMPMSPPSSAMPSPNPAANGKTTPNAIPGRATPSGTRKRSVTKHMISEPTFVSSTSTVPLVHLPRDGGPAVEAVLPPPVPTMNPRRRGTAPEEHFAPHPAVTPGAITPAESPRNFDFSNSSQSLVKPPTPRQGNKLRKVSSEGGSMAARARHHALAAEFAREKDRSPNVAVFPNRSTTSLATQEAGMF